MSSLRVRKNGVSQITNKATTYKKNKWEEQGTKYPKNSKSNYKRKFINNSEKISDMILKVSKIKTSMVHSLHEDIFNFFYSLQKELIMSGESCITLIFLDENQETCFLNITDSNYTQKSLDFDFNNTISNIPYIPKVSNFDSEFEIHKDFRFSTYTKHLFNYMYECSYTTLEYLGSIQSKFLADTNEFEIEKVFIKVDDLYPNEEVSKIFNLKENLFSFLKSVKDLEIFNNQLISESYFNEMKNICTEILKNKVTSTEDYKTPIKDKNLFLNNFVMLNESDNTLSITLKNKKLI